MISNIEEKRKDGQMSSICLVTTYKEKMIKIMYIIAKTESI